ncbi:hypothetical protein [Anaeromyxobacter diazotrophicus]|uniref:Type II secretion system protein GspE N-terminal domain-containing protein n=1 Tax=Anaeromyxobacter diazotrophicus TaxID=2590199 RepID=A0A7I9VN99_9BACT|nr:hypothetical protein [Anaeromyxobacter diazotrophicus]GEJ57457.1 hypothetical protein AMYX_21980 [Anaeromyxobacter diazotrophicus]
MTREPTELVLLRTGHLQPWQVQRAQAHQRRAGGTVVEALIALGYLTEQAALTEAARQLGVPYRDLSHLYVPPEIVALVPERLIRARKVFPIDVAAESRRGPLIVATAAPQDLTVLDEVAFASELQVRAVLASARDVDAAIERYLGPAARRGIPLIADPAHARQPAVAAGRLGATNSWRGGPVAEANPRPTVADAIATDWTQLRWTA